MKHFRLLFYALNILIFSITAKADEDIWWMGTVVKDGKACGPAGVAMSEYTSFLESQGTKYEFMPDTEQFSYYGLVEHIDAERVGVGIWSRTLKDCTFGIDMSRLNGALNKVVRALGDKFDKMNDEQKFKATQDQYKEMWGTDISRARYSELVKRVKGDGKSKGNKGHN